MKAEILLVQNIRSLLAARGVDAAALAFAVGHSQAWISKILSGDRFMKLADMDAIADFFGLTVSQLLQHGIAPLTERRRRDRRCGQDRRGKDRRQQSQGERAGQPPPRAKAGKPATVEGDMRLRLMEN